MDELTNRWKNGLLLVALSLLAPLVYAIALISRISTVTDGLAGIYAQRVFASSTSTLFAFQYSHPIYQHMVFLNPASYLPLQNEYVLASMLFFLSLSMGLILLKKKHSTATMVTTLSAVALAGSTLFVALYAQPLLWAAFGIVCLIALILCTKKYKMALLVLGAPLSFFDPSAYLIFLISAVIIDPAVVKTKVQGIFFTILSIFSVFVAFAFSEIDSSLPWFFFEGFRFVELGYQFGISLPLLLFGLVGAFMALGKKRSTLTSLAIVVGFASLFSPVALLIFSLVCCTLAGLFVEKIMLLNWNVDWMRWVVIMSLFCSLFISTTIIVQQYVDEFPQREDLQVAQFIKNTYSEQTIVLSSVQMQHLLERFSAARGHERNPNATLDLFTVSDKGIVLPHLEFSKTSLIVFDSAITQQFTTQNDVSGLSLLVRDVELFVPVYTGNNTAIFSIK